MRTRRAADRALGVAAGLLGAVVLAGAGAIERQAGEGLTPRAFPVGIGLGLVVSGAAVALAARRPDVTDHEIDWPAPEGFRRIGVVLAVTAAYIASLSLLGFPLASFFFVAGLSAYLGGRAWLAAAVAGAVTALALYVVFIRLLGLALPSGPLP